MNTLSRIFSLIPFVAFVAASFGAEHHTVSFVNKSVVASTNPKNHG